MRDRVKLECAEHDDWLKTVGEGDLSTITWSFQVSVRKGGGLRDCRRGKVKAREDAEFVTVL